MTRFPLCDGRRVLLLLLAVGCCVVWGRAQGGAAPLPQVVQAGGARAWLVEVERERVLRLAAAAMAREPVTLRSAELPRHAVAAGVQPGDFLSMGDYWWPNPEAPNGLPYVRRDGQSNPENFDAHRLLMREMRDVVAALAAGYVVAGEAATAHRAMEWLRVFFVDEATRMQPHLRFAQAIPGVTPGRGIGIIDTLHLVEVVPALEAVAGAPGVDPATVAAVQRWFGDYLRWMLTHPNGREEGATRNNHSVAYWLQVALFARAAGDLTALAEAGRQWREVMLPDQMGLDGGFPRELARTKPYGYAIFQLDNVVLLTDVLAESEPDIWQFRLSDGRSVERALAYLYPFLADKSTWPLAPDVEHFADWPVRGPALLLGGLRLGRPEYLDLWRRLESDPTNMEVRRNLAVTQPVLWVR